MVSSNPTAAKLKHNGPYAKPLAELFWPKVDKSAGPDECWPYTGAIDRYGYGKVYVRRGVGDYFWEHASRTAYRLTYGEVALSVLHRCDNPPCCNPSHLFEGSQFDNLVDMTTKGRRRGWPRKT